MLKVFGEKYTNYFLGKPIIKLEMPKIPIIKENAKATSPVVEDDINDEKLRKDNKKFNFFFIREIFQATLERKATTGEAEQWMNALGQGASRDGLYRSIVLGDNYRELERQKEDPSDKVLELTKLILNKYLALNAEEDALKSLNMYSLKRITVEKSLEVIDAFAARSKTDLSTWYGIMSAELAENYGEIWKNELRKDKSDVRHKEWAMKVPLQHIKSEVMIKLHSAFNSIR